jgi:hypothetical protein
MHNSSYKTMINIPVDKPTYLIQCGTDNTVYPPIYPQSRSKRTLSRTGGVPKVTKEDPYMRDKRLRMNFVYTWE